MSNTNTDQRVIAGQAAQIKAPTAATVTYFQYAAQPSQAVQTGTIKLPIPGQFKAVNKKVKVRVYGNSLLATVGSQALTVTVNSLVGTTETVIATTGAVACATVAGATIGWYLELEVLFDATTSAVLAGEYQGVSVSGAGHALVARTIITAAPGFTQTAITGAGVTEGFDENQYFTVAITQAQTDATAVHTLLELSAEVL